MNRFFKKVLSGFLGVMLIMTSVTLSAFAGAGDVKSTDIVENFDKPISAGKEICGGFIYSVSGQWAQSSEIKKGDRGKSLELKGDTYLYIWREGKMSLTFDAYFDTLPTQNWDVNAKNNGTDQWVYAMLNINGQDKTFGFNGKTMPAEEDRWYNFYFDWDFTDSHMCSVYVDDVLLNTMDISGHSKLNRIGLGAQKDWYMDNLIWDADLSDEPPMLPDDSEEPEPDPDPDPDVPPTASDELEEHKKLFVQTSSRFVDFNSYTDVLSSSSLENGMIVLNQGAGWNLSTINSDKGDEESGQSLKIVGEGLKSPVPRLLFYNTAGAGKIHEISFDIYYDEFSSYRKDMNYTLAHSGGDTWIGGIQIGANGEVLNNGSDTGKRIQTGEWHTITYFVDCVNFKVWHLFDGEQVYYGAPESHYTRLSRIELTTADGNVYIDNVKQFRYSLSPKAVSATASGYSAEIMMSAGIDTAIGDFSDYITLWKDDNEIDIESVEYISDEKKFVISTKKPIETCSKYVVKFDSTLISDEGVPFDDDYSYTFTSSSNTFDVTSLVKNSDGSYTAKVSNRSGKTRTVIMVIVGKSSDGSIVSMDSSESYQVANKTVTIKLSPTVEAESYDIYFIDSWESRISIKKPILPDVQPSDADPAIKSVYNPASNSLDVTGVFGDAKDTYVTLSIASEDISISPEGEVISNPFNDDVKPLFITVVPTDENGALSAQFKLNSDIEPGVYYLYADSEANRGFARFIVTNEESAETKDAIKMCNTSGSQSELSAYLVENIEYLGIDKNSADGYYDDIAKRILQNRPSNGYSLSELNDIINYAIASAKIENGESVDSVMQEYAYVFGCLYEDYNNLSDDEAKAFDLLISEIIANKELVTYEETALVASVRLSASTWGKLRDCVIENADALGIEVGKKSKYMKISSSYRGEVFEEMKKRASRAISVKEIAEAFDDAVDYVYDNHKKDDSGSSSSGKGNSSSKESYVNVGIDNGETKPIVPVIVYNDLDNHFSKEAVEFLSAKKIISGYPDGSFMPDKPVSRAEFSKMIALAFDIQSKNESQFDDVSQNDWFYDCVCALSFEGIILGDGMNFYPTNNITRQDAVVIIERVLKLSGKTYSGKASYDDMSEVSGYALDAVDAMTKAGVIKGNNNCFYPLSTITRAEAAVMIYRAFNIRMEG